MSKMMIGMRDQKTRARKVRRTDMGGDTSELIYFYSPETKSIVKLTIDSELSDANSGTVHYEMELIKYGHEAPVVKTPMVKAPK